MFELLIIAAVAVAYIANAIYVIFLTISMIVEWFDEWRSRHATVNQHDRDRIGFTLKELMASGDYKVVQGVFNKSTEALEDARRIKAQDMDATLSARHRNDALVVYS